MDNDTQEIPPMLSDTIVSMHQHLMAYVATQMEGMTRDEVEATDVESPKGQAIWLSAIMVYLRDLLNEQQIRVLLGILGEGARTNNTRH